MHGLIELLNEPKNEQAITCIVDDDPSTWPFKYTKIRDAPPKHAMILGMIRAPEMSEEQIRQATKISRRLLKQIVHHPPNRKFLENFNTGVVGDLEKMQVSIADLHRAGVEIEKRFLRTVDRALQEVERENDLKLLKEINPIIRTVHQITADSMNRHPTGELSYRKPPEERNDVKHLTANDVKDVMKLAKAMQDNAEPIEAEFVEVNK
jgi:hypothetical protein